MAANYNASDFGKKEEELQSLFNLQMNDAKRYFQNVIKPRLDRSYKLYIAYTGDRAREIKPWQSNVFVPYIMSTVETLVPRILDARPEFTVQGRSFDDQMKTEKQQQLADYFWEKSKMDKTSELFTRSALIYGTGFMQVSWKKDVRKYKFLEDKDISKKKYTYKERSQTFYDAPYCEWVDNYSLWYDWHNTERESKQYWFKRLILTEGEIRRKYPNADKKRLELAIKSPGGDLTDFASVRTQVKASHEHITKRATSSFPVGGDDKYNASLDSGTKMYEVFEWWRPFDDEYAVMVGGSHVPILRGASLPNPYDHKEAPFIEAPYLKIPNEFEGYGLPMILENPQIMLNLIKNQRLDAATLSIHKMWIVNPLANINKEELVTRPFGIIYSIDPNGVREVQFSDIKQSAYREEDLLKQDMRYSSGVDDFSMGVGGGAGSATEVRHLRESTLERVRLFVNHLGEAYSDVLRYWMNMQKQFFTKKMYIRVLGDDGSVKFPLIEKDDLEGMFDYRATVLPSIAGQVDVRRKQNLDLFQLLVSLPFIDPKKLTSKVLQDFGWNLENVSLSEEDMQAMQSQMPGAEGEEMPPEGVMPPGGAMPPEGAVMPDMSTRGIPQNVLTGALQMMRGSGGRVPAAGVTQFSEASNPINLLQGGPPPTVAGVPRDRDPGGGGPGFRTSNQRGFNRTGKLNINNALNVNSNSNPESELLKSVNNLQRKKK